MVDISDEPDELELFDTLKSKEFILSEGAPLDSHPFFESSFANRIFSYTLSGKGRDYLAGITKENNISYKLMSNPEIVIEVPEDFAIKAKGQETELLLHGINKLESFYELHPSPRSSDILSCARNLLSCAQQVRDGRNPEMDKYLDGLFLLSCLQSNDARLAGAADGKASRLDSALRETLASLNYQLHT
ncbi:hypothetical protein HYU14_07395 [Candidatus Woesearchaeota archaeon]|nr:hypothetical protein [Candidatus Woesearchaeota archaeon]